MHDYLIVGAGFAGAVLAERLANKNKKVLVIDRRSHIAGNCHDAYKDGILIHTYGPHIFHTSYTDVFEYLSRFTDWIKYEHKVLAHIDGQNVPIPFNLNSIEQVFDVELATRLKKVLIDEYGMETKVPIVKLIETDNKDLKFLADFIYDKVFVNYTKKQWGKSPEELDPSIFSRVPVFVSRDNRYFQDTYQGLPKEGYTKMFERMLDHPNIEVRLNTEYEKQIGDVIYTGCIDELHDYKFGKLQYRSLEFGLETHDGSYQEAAVINYPNDHDYTRITEYKKLTMQEHAKTIIAKEYPRDEGEPYYPLFTKEAKAHYAKYAGLDAGVVMLGRLAEYKYYDMDDICKRALEIKKQSLNVDVVTGATGSSKGLLLAVQDAFDSY